MTAPLVTALAIGAGVAITDVDHPDTTRAATASAGSLSAAGASLTRGTAPARRDTDRTLAISRSVERVPLVEQAVPSGARRLWTTTALDLRTQPAPAAKVAGQLEPRRRVRVTGNRTGGFAEVVDGTSTRWVKAEYLAVDKPKPPAPAPAKPAAPSPQAGLADQSCAGTSDTENGLTDSAVKVYRAVCNAFPAISAYGGYDAHGEHASGRAIDIMVGDTGLGDEIADFLRAHSGELNLYDVIWSQRIWTPERFSEGWRSMPDRGSATANHFDHVHVSVN